MFYLKTCKLLLLYAVISLGCHPVLAVEESTTTTTKAALAWDYYLKWDSWESEEIPEVPDYDDYYFKPISTEEISEEDDFFNEFSPSAEWIFDKMGKIKEPEEDRSPPKDASDERELVNDDETHKKNFNDNDIHFPDTDETLNENADDSDLNFPDTDETLNENADDKLKFTDSDEPPEENFDDSDTKTMQKEDCDSSLFSEHDIMDIIEFLFNQSDAESLKHKFFENAHELSERLNKNLDSFVQVFSQKPSHLKRIIEKTQKERIRLETLLPEIRNLRQAFPALNDWFSQLNGKLTNLREIGRIANLNCQKYNCPAPPRRIYATRPRSKRQVPQSEKYCMPIDKLYSDIKYSIETFNTNLYETGLNKLDTDSQIYEEKIESVKVTLEKKAIDAFGETMYDVLHLQDQLIEAENIMESAIIEPNEVRFIESLLQRLENSIQVMEPVIRRLSTYCRSCRRRRQSMKGEESQPSTSKEITGIEDINKDITTRKVKRRKRVKSSNSGSSKSSGSSSSSNFGKNPRKKFHKRSKRNPNDYDDDYEDFYSYYKLIINDDRNLKNFWDIRGKSANIKDASQSIIHQLVQQFYEEQLVELKEEYDSIFLDLDRKIATTTDTFLEDMEPIQKDIFEMIVKESDEVRRLIESIPSLQGVTNLTKGVLNALDEVGAALRGFREME